jgi:ribosomal-protein-alanine N-acetyltransferase
MEDSKAFLHYQLQGYAEGRPYVWGVELKENGKLIGTAGFLEWSEYDKRIDIGYAISERHWNKGIVTEVSKEIVRYGFEELRLNKIAARCTAENSGSEKVMLKLGMKLEGVLLQHVYKDGNYHDIKHYAILAKSWALLNK